MYGDFSGIERVNYYAVLCIMQCYVVLIDILVFSGASKPSVNSDRQATTFVGCLPKLKEKLNCPELDIGLSLKRSVFYVLLIFGVYLG